MSEFEPSDWKKTRVPNLAQLDSLQRCLICKDFLKAPVITSCNHTFCSQCIRQHLMSVSNCPLCKAEQFESNLKRVTLLEEIVLCFQSLREDLISLVTSKSDPAATERPGQKMDPSDKEIEIIDITDEIAGPGTDSTLNNEQKPGPGFVPCPVCGVVMRKEHVQGSHLDYCLSGKSDPKLFIKANLTKRKRNDVLLFFQSQKLPKVSKQATVPLDREKFYFEQGEKHHHDVKRIPKIDFASLSTAKIKEKLTAHKLSTLGSRTDLEWRYNHYYLLHQSNLDSNHPLSELELRQKLKQWELSNLATSSSVASNTIYGDALSRKSMSDKDFPVKTWLDLYKDDFRRLVKQAKNTRKGKKKMNKEAEEAVQSNLSDSTREPIEAKMPASHREPTNRQQDSSTKVFESKNETQISTKSNVIDDPELSSFDFTKSTLFPSE